MPEVDIKKLFEAGAHFGHKTSRWNPKMAPFIHSKRGDSHIINLDKTVEFVTKNSSYYTLLICYEENQIDETVNTKFLGLQIYNHINWKNNIE